MIAQHMRRTADEATAPVQVFDLLKEDDVMEEVAEPKVVLEREYTDSDSEDEKSDESALFFFSNEVIPGVSRNRLHHTVTVPAKGRRQKGTVLHSAPHSSMFDAMARYQNGLFATSGRNITGKVTCVRVCSIS